MARYSVVDNAQESHNLEFALNGQISSMNMIIDCGRQPSEDHHKDKAITEWIRLKEDNPFNVPNHLVLIEEYSLVKEDCNAI